MEEPTSPGRDSGVELEPVGGPGRSGSLRVPLVALGALVAMVAVSIALALRYPPSPGPSTSVSPLAAAVPPSAATAASPSPSSGVGAPPRLRAAELVAGVRDGSLDGDLVYADATLSIACHVATAFPCASPDLSIDGLALDVVAGVTGRALGAPPARAVLVLAVSDGTLVYLGPLIVHPDGSPPLTAVASATARPTGAGESAEPPLTDVGGWLVLKGPCLTPPTAFLACPRRSFIADDEPLPNGRPRTDARTFVRVADGAWGISPPFEPVLAGPFLVRRITPGTDHAAWEVVARYDPSRSVRVVIP